MASKYQFVARELEQMLRRWENRKLPTEAELCALYGCSRQTVRSALAVLEEKGLIVKRQGSGTYPAGTVSPVGREIAVVLADREEYLSPGLLRDIRRGAGEMYVSCYETFGDPVREQEILQKLLTSRPAGVLLEPITDALGSLHTEILTMFPAEGIPLIFLNGCYREVPGAYCAGMDDREGAQLLMNHLAAHGHKSVAMILKGDDSRGIARYQGACRAAGEMGITALRETTLWYTEQERLRLLEGDDSLLHRFLREYRRNCTAVICFNDEIAFRLIKLLQGEKPLSVVSFDNSYLALSREPSITTLGPEGNSVGAAAAGLLQELMEGRRPASPVLHWQLHARMSG